MQNRRLILALILASCLGAACGAQVISIAKIRDLQAQRLQLAYIAQLRDLSADAVSLHFPFPFYFSETLDIDEARQKQLAQGSVHFDRFQGQMVLEITGNYYASYSTTVLTPNQRARKTFQDVILPLLKIAVRHIDRKVPIDAYAFEVAHHVRAQVLKVDTEGPENLTLIIPRILAERLVVAQDQETAQAVLLESSAYLNSEPLTLWLTGDDAPADVNERYIARQKPAPDKQSTPANGPQEPGFQEPGSQEPGSLVSSQLMPQSELLSHVREYNSTPHEVSPERLEKLQTSNQATLERMVADLKPQAHFVDYAAPAFIAFHEGAYLQLSMTTELEQPAGPSQYRIAALAFDQHIAHLLRPIAKYFHGNPQFEGIDLSTTVHQAVQPATQSVEFVVPLNTLACYEKYDCTGQELINRSIVLINGERVTLDLQKAENDTTAGGR
ncbi:MAG TPA: hypothetical protein VKT33_10755 [Candidatus Angelobacter sp.]|nr:hypothetical protein [Candidatus Angelobacter sp.]